MKDRVPLYPGRVKLTPVSEQENTYDMVRADEPTQEGDPLSKATFLKDATAALFGLGNDAVPDDVFSTLSECLPQILVTTLPNIEVTASLNGRTVRATSDSSGLAVLKVTSYGVWTISANIYGLSVSTNCEIKAIAQYELSLFPALESTDWGSISSISESGNASKIWNIGDKKTVAIDGVNYQIQIIGFDHDTKTSGGKAGITFQLVNCLNNTYQMNSSDTNAGGWTSCAMRTSTMATLFTKLPSELQNVIKAVDKLTSAGQNSDTINTTSDKLFLLCAEEVYGAAYYAKPGEGSWYAYYKAGNSNGSGSKWWERSPSSANSFAVVWSDGRAAARLANESNGVSFAFCV